MFTRRWRHVAAGFALLFGFFATPWSELRADDKSSDSIAPRVTSINVFRRFTVDRAKMIEFYGDVLRLKPLLTFSLGGGGQMTRFQVGTSEVKLTADPPGRRPRGSTTRIWTRPEAGARGPSHRIRAPPPESPAKTRRDGTPAGSDGP